MSAVLHVFKDDQHIAEFDLAPGLHLLGVSENAQLLLGSDRIDHDVCYVDLDAEGQLTLLPLPSVGLRQAIEEPAPELTLRNGENVKLAGLTLTLIRTADHGDVQVVAPRVSAPTEKSKHNHPAPADTLALLVTTLNGTTVVELDRPTITIGREPGNTVRIGHHQVSAYHAEVTQTATVPWLKDLGSTNGTFVNGVLFSSGAFPKGAHVHLSPAMDAPILELVTRAEALGRNTGSGALLALVGSSARMVEFCEQVARFGKLSQTVLILGETGTGKELTARALAEIRGKDKKFVVFNCGDLERELAGSELFGHVKGAFTGAIRDRQGHFEYAEYGTVFLDEVGELPLDLQAKLLRVLDFHTIQRRGESKEREIHCRVVAATNRDLMEMVKAGTFRLDLYQRLSTLELTAPPLRTRLSDLYELSAALLGRMRGDGQGRVLSHAAIAKLAEYHWPGNVRELSNVLQRAAIRTQGLEIPPEAIVFSESRASPALVTAGELHATEEERRRLVEQEVYQRAMDEAGGNLRQMARLLKTNHTAVRRRLRDLGLRTPTQKTPVESE